MHRGQTVLDFTLWGDFTQIKKKQNKTCTLWLDKKKSFNG